jgi:hypothetical protein
MLSSGSFERTFATDGKRAGWRDGGFWIVLATALSVSAARLRSAGYGAWRFASSGQCSVAALRAAARASDDVPQAALERHLGGTLPCRVEPVFKVFDSDPVLDLRLVDGHHDARGAAIGAFAPLVPPENAQRLSHGLV